MKKFISWRRVSTKKQGRSGLGLEAQKEVIRYFVKAEKGELIADYCEIYTGKDLANCVELQAAIKACKDQDATLIIAKTDRFRNCREALDIYEQLQGRIFFCDLPSVDKFTLTLFFALAEREALITSIRTRQALAVKKAQGVKLGRPKGSSMRKAYTASADKRREDAKVDRTNRAIWEVLKQCTSNGTLRNQDAFMAAIRMLNNMGIKTSTGLNWTLERLRSAEFNLRKIYLNQSGIKRKGEKE